jgi:hypothetical protein
VAPGSGLACGHAKGKAQSAFAAAFLLVWVPILAPSTAARTFGWHAPRFTATYEPPKEA